MFKSYLQTLYLNASNLNQRNILTALSVCDRGGVLLDLGCDDGEWSRRLGDTLKSQQILGVEIVEDAARSAEAKGLKVLRQSLDQKWEIPTASIDVVHANQVIEHLCDVDHFAQEIFRVLKPGKHFVVSTENGSSWHNVFAALMGWQIFSLTNVSRTKTGLGNPLALHKNEVPQASWCHKTIFNYQGLIDFFKAHGFTEIQVSGAGYHPLPAGLGRVDPRHSHFLTISGMKPHM